MSLVSVCVCTFRRAHVAETIRSLLAQDVEEKFEIVVVDDDPDRSAEALVAGFAEARLPVRYVHAGVRNVSAARNAALDAATGAWIAFIDDDEVAHRDWLRRLLAVQREMGADIVKGYVRGVYPGETPAWLVAADPFTRDYGADGAEPKELASGNVLFRRALIEANKLRFDLQFGRTGGEDSDFFARLRAAGARAVACRSAVVDEVVPADRMAGPYLRARGQRMGQTDGRKARARGRMLGPLVSAGLGAGLGWAHPLLRPFSPRASYKALLKFWYSVGVFEGVVGRQTKEM